MRDFFVITGKVEGFSVYWQKWTGASVSGRPKWVRTLSSFCLFDALNTAQKMADGKGSTHWHTVFEMDINGDGFHIKDIRVQKATLKIEN
jgi:hypothetical protein